MTVAVLAPGIDGHQLGEPTEHTDRFRGWFVWCSCRWIGRTPDHGTITDLNEPWLRHLAAVRPADPAPITNPIQYTLAGTPLDDRPDYRPNRRTLSTGARRTLEQHETIRAGRHPVTRLPLLNDEWGYQCGDCAHLFANSRNRTYWKCALNATRGPATDIRKKWPACARLRIEGTR